MFWKMNVLVRKKKIASTPRIEMLMLARRFVGGVCTFRCLKNGQFEMMRQ